MQACLQSLISIPQMLPVSQQAAQNIDNGWALMEFSEDSKNRESFPGQGQKMLQVGDTMEEVGKENEGMISELPSDFLRWWELLQTCLEVLGTYYQI